MNPGDEEMKWNGEEVAKKIQALVKRNLLMVAIEMVRDLKKTLGVSAGGAAKRARLTRSTIRDTAERDSSGQIEAITNPNSTKRSKLEIKKSDVKNRKTQEQYRHSLPGESPRKITGFLQANVTFKDEEPGEMRVKVGLFRNAIYGYYLEKGVRKADGMWKIAPRPWFLATLIRNLAKYGRIAVNGRARG